MRIAIIVLLVMVSFTGCHSAERRLQPAEAILDTGGSSTLPFHSVLYYPSELSLRFDGYIVGIEKSPRKKISNPEDMERIQSVPEAGLIIETDIVISEPPPFFNSEGQNLTKKLLLNDGRLLFISHIVENFAPFTSNEMNCTIYNSYHLKDTAHIRQFAPSCPDNSLNQPVANTDIFKYSWKALELLEGSIAKRINNGNYSHIVVITMGWNTQQEEAIRNFNSIVKSLKLASIEQGSRFNFNPLVIGVTWPSQWESSWIPSVIFETLSFPVKAGDANELGLTWLGVLLNITIPNIKKAIPSEKGDKLKVVVIGHSFGSRASSIAACIGPVIYESERKIGHADIDFLINYQGAFQSKLLFGKRSGSFYFPDRCKNVKHLVLTSSKEDKAVKSSIWGTPYAGDNESFETYCKDDSSINCVVAGADGHIAQQTHSSESNILYINANDLIKENAYSSGGGAHSDIYRKEHGVLLVDLLSENWKQKSRAWRGGAE